MQELYDFPATQVTGGSSWVMVNSNLADVIFWGTPTAGKFGLEGNSKSSANPKFVTATAGLVVKNITCGYGHCCMIATRLKEQSQSEYDEKMISFPELFASSEKSSNPKKDNTSNVGKRKQKSTSNNSNKRGKK